VAGLTFLFPRIGLETGHRRSPSLVVSWRVMTAYPEMRRESHRSEIQNGLTFLSNSFAIIKKT
jgi:hypothetical protein